MWRYKRMGSKISFVYLNNHWYTSWLTNCTYNICQLIFHTLMISPIFVARYICSSENRRQCWQCLVEMPFLKHLLNISRHLNFFKSNLYQFLIVYFLKSFNSFCPTVYISRFLDSWCKTFHDIHAAWKVDRFILLYFLYFPVPSFFILFFHPVFLLLPSSIFFSFCFFVFFCFLFFFFP